MPRTGRPREAQSTTMRALVAIRHGGAPLNEIVAFTGRPRKAVYMALHEWRKRGVVRRPRRGWYEPTEAL